MSNSANDFWHRSFSHLYIEESAYDYPLTHDLIERFSNSRVVQVRNYKSVFARPRQHFQTQKQSINLILAVKKDQFVYPGSGQSQSFGYDNFYYNTLILNCIYNCDYCYLQGMYPSANIVVFVNLEDYFTAIRRTIEQRKNQDQQVYLCISYDTDLLAFERIVPYCRAWIEFTRAQSDLLIEIRTKSALYSAIKDLTPMDRVTLAWTLSPDSVVDRYEQGTPPLRQRLQAACDALEDRWPVRLCFDPMLSVPDWETQYTALIDQTFEKLPADRIQDVTLGLFRMNTGYFDRIKKQRQDSDLLFYPYERESNTVSYPQEQRTVMVERMKQALTHHIPEERIAIWM